MEARFIEMHVLNDLGSILGESVANNELAVNSVIDEIWLALVQFDKMLILFKNDNGTLDTEIMKDRIPLLMLSLSVDLAARTMGTEGLPALISHLSDNTLGRRAFVTYTHLESLVGPRVTAQLSQIMFAYELYPLINELYCQIFYDPRYNDQIREQIFKIAGWLQRYLGHELHRVIGSMVQRDYITLLIRDEHEQ